MGTLALFIVMSSTPAWHQGEGVACSEALGKNVPILMLDTFGGVGRNDDGKPTIVLDERNNLLRRVSCKKVKTHVAGHEVEVYRVYEYDEPNGK